MNSGEKKLKTVKQTNNNSGEEMLIRKFEVSLTHIVEYYQRIVWLRDQLAFLWCSTRSSKNEVIFFSGFENEKEVSEQGPG